MSGLKPGFLWVAAALCIVVVMVCITFAPTEGFDGSSTGGGVRSGTTGHNVGQAPRAKAATSSGTFAAGNTDLGTNPDNNTGRNYQLPTNMGTDMGKNQDTNASSNGGILATMSQCPTQALRQPDGTIKVMPEGRTFFTLSDYITYLSGLYSNGSQCVPPQVEDIRSPVFGILGGVGVSAPSPADVKLETTTRSVLDTAALANGLNPQEPITKLDDYEYERVFQLEDVSRNTITDVQNNELMNEHIFDWANLPFNSEERAIKEDTFVAGRMESGFPEPKTGVIFNDISGRNVYPPDKQAEYLREQKLLATYRPTDFSKHVVDNETEQVAKLVSKMYENDKNWAPVVTKTDEGKYAVTELRPKSRKELWEDAQTINMVATAGFEDKSGTGPTANLEIIDRLHIDPFFDKGGVMPDVARKRVWDYSQFNQWTPDLERMFAPTAGNKAWY